MWPQQSLEPLPPLGAWPRSLTLHQCFDKLPEMMGRLKLLSVSSIINGGIGASK